MPSGVVENSAGGNGVTASEVGIEVGIAEFAGRNWLAVGSGPS